MLSTETKPALMNKSLPAMKLSELVTTATPRHLLFFASLRQLSSSREPKPFPLVLAVDHQAMDDKVTLRLHGSPRMIAKGVLDHPNITEFP